MWAELQTIQETYERIVQGERPWNALGDFLSYWHVYAVDRRTALIEQPIVVAEEASEELRRWAAYGAAMVEYLCARDQLVCPAWVAESRYRLADAWYTGLGASKPQVQARLRAESPAPFRARNIFCRAHDLSTKYDIAAHRQLQLA